MSEEEEIIKKLAEFKAKLEDRIKKAEEELENLKAIREALDTILIEKGFKRAKLVAPPPPEKKENVIPVKTVEGKHLADIYFKDGNLRVVPSEDVSFYLTTPPFRSFLIERVLEKMRLKDQEASMRGDIPPEKILNYDIRSENGVLKEIVIENVTQERFHELKSTIRWTLEKMYEKSSLK